MPRARSASTMRGSIVAGNGAYTGGRAGKCREAVMAALWFVALTRERGLAPRRAAWLAFLVAVGWAFFDELHQATEPSRTASAMDVAIDAMGALAASTIGRHGWGRALDVASAGFLWVAAAGGAVVMALDLASGVAPGVLWLTVPAAMVALVLRRRAGARARRGAVTPTP